MKSLIHFSLVLLATSMTAPGASIEPPKRALEAIDAAGLLEHIKVLGSDEFEGRAPGTPGEDLSVQYISEQFKKLGLKPATQTAPIRKRCLWPAFIAHPLSSLPSATKA